MLNDLGGPNVITRVLYKWGMETVKNQKDGSTRRTSPKIAGVEDGRRP